MTPLGTVAWQEIRGLTREGYPYAMLEPKMTRIPDTYLDFVIYLYGSEKDASEGHHVGGTGFLVVVPSGAVYAVTNRHVIEEGSCTIRLNTHEGKASVLPTSRENWVVAENDDLACCWLGIEQEFYRFSCMGSETWFLNDALMAEHNIGVGDEIFFLGRFRSHAGKGRNLPIVRFGNIAMMPNEPILNAHLGKPQESLLVEAHSQSGFSGSPVIVTVPSGSFRGPGRGQVHGTTRFYLLGVDWGHFPDFDNPKQNSGIVAVVPAWKLRAFLLEDQRVLDMTEALEEKRVLAEQTGGQVVLDSAQEGDEYTRFEALTRRLAQVPKKEVDDLEKADPSRTAPSDKPSDDASKDQSAEEERS